LAASRIDTFKQMLEGDPSNTMVMFGLANEYLKAERWKDAIDILNKYLSHADDEGAAYGMLARAYEKTGNRDEARASYERGIKVAESHGHPSMAGDFQMTLDTDYAD
jgi:predicted Zn-dependent protease